MASIDQPKAYGFLRQVCSAVGLRTRDDYYFCVSIC